MFSEIFFKLAVSIVNNTEKINTKKGTLPIWLIVQCVIITFIYNLQIH